MYEACSFTVLLRLLSYMYLDSFSISSSLESSLDSQFINRREAKEAPASLKIILHSSTNG